MLKLVVLCAFFAAAAGKPDVFLTSPLTPLTTIVSPAEATILKQASSVVHPSPILYNTPWAYSHYIKKRSPQFPISYFGPNTYLTTSPIATTYTAPLIQSASILPAATLPLATTHLIKKRSAPLLSTSYAATPLVASTYTATAPLISTTPYLTSASLIPQPITYSTHFIKKRSAPLLTSYISPAAISQQSRIDLHSTPWVTTYNSPGVYSASVPAFTTIV